MLIFASASGRNSPSRYATPCSAISACGDGPAAAFIVLAIVSLPLNKEAFPFGKAFGI
jgi:hypothetical protein